MLDSKRRDRAKVLLLESRSSGVIWDAYLRSMLRRRFLCQVAAGENDDDDVDMTSLLDG